MNEAVLENEELEVQSEAVDDGVESASTKEVPDGFIPVEENQRQVNKQHRKYRDAEREAKQAKAEADKLKQELEELKAQSVDLTVPPIPDPYSENFEEQVRVRDEAIARKTKHEAAQSDLEKRAKQNEQDALESQKAEEAKQVEAFDANMVTLGLNPIEVKQAAETLLDYGLSDTLQDIVLEDSDGPLFVQYLANNPLELESLNGMSALQMVKVLDSDIRQKASLLKPKTSRAPDPPETLTGGGVTELEDPLLKGARFE